MNPYLAQIGPSIGNAAYSASLHANNSGSNTDVAAAISCSFSICEWGISDPWQWGKQVGNSWRTEQDIEADWDSILDNLDSVVGLAKYAGPGGWNDPDMLEVIF